MAGRYTFGIVGCLAGVLVCVGVCSVRIFAFGTNLTFQGRAGVFAAGGVAGGLLSALFWGNRDGRWVKGVLLPEAQKAGIRPQVLLAILEGGDSKHQVEDELGLLRQLAPALRAELGPLATRGCDFIFR